MNLQEQIKKLNTRIYESKRLVEVLDFTTCSLPILVHRATNNKDMEIFAERILKNIEQIKEDLNEMSDFINNF